MQNRMLLNILLPRTVQSIHSPSGHRPYLSNLIQLKENSANNTILARDKQWSSYPGFSGGKCNDSCLFTTTPSLSFIAVAATVWYSPLFSFSQFYTTHCNRDHHKLLFPVSQIRISAALSECYRLNCMEM